MLPVTYNDPFKAQLRVSRGSFETISSYPQAPELAVVANDLSIEARFLYSSVPETELYHHVTHISSCVHAVTRLKEDYAEFPINTQDIINKFNIEQGENGRPLIKSVDEFFAVLSQATLYHDIGNLFYLDESYKNSFLYNDLAHLVAEQSESGLVGRQLEKPPVLSIADFADKLEELNGSNGITGLLDKNKPVKRLLEGHNEKGAEFRSLDILLFSIKYSLATQYRVEAGLPGANPNEISKKYQRLYDLSVDFVSKFIAETIYSVNEVYTNPLSQISKWVDRVAPYYGVSIADLILLIKSLASEKVAENRGSTPQVSLKSCFNYPFLELIKICNDDQALLQSLIAVGSKLKIGDLLRVAVEDIPGLPNEEWEQKKTWKQIYDFLNTQQIV